MMHSNIHSIQNQSLILAANAKENAESVQIISTVNQILTNAVQMRASDIHFEPLEKCLRIRYRIDGLLHEIVSFEHDLAPRITSRIKIMASLDIAEKRLPQDGRFNIQMTAVHAIDCRVSTCPTIYGEKTVVRILNLTAKHPTIEELGLNVQQKECILKSIQRPQGLILVTGPTGSGKTITLYSIINQLNSESINISTIEDPIEMKIKGINQVNINPKIGLTFHDTLRAFLRQDPDIIMVGEIRDRETAEIAIKASQTGHLVLSTLHTNNAAETLIRLLNMGIPAFYIANSISLIIAQRLVRVLCNHCKTLCNTPTHESGLTPFYKAQSCIECLQGYYGRTGIFEIMPISQSIKNLIMTSKNVLDIQQAAQQEGMISLYQSSLEKIKNGITSFAECDRVLKE